MNHDHKNGRPPRSASQATRNVTVRLTEDELAGVDVHVGKSGKPRGVLIREAMEAFGLFAPPRKRS